MRFKFIYIYNIALICLASTTMTSDKINNWTPTDIQLLNQKSIYHAGESIIFEFSTSESLTPLLYCNNSYGSTLVKPTKKNARLIYTLPPHMSRKSGILHWKLLDIQSTISGIIQIVPKTHVAEMETYIGPPSIEAGGTDYTMLVVIPTDDLDNPLPDKTKVSAKYQFLNTLTVDSIQTNHLIAYKTIKSKQETGRMLVSSESRNTNSKEFTINVLAAIPKGFSISAQRPHDYADGNQQTTFSTSILKDEHGNIVSDGTFVTFSIKTSKGNILETYGSTIKGIADARMIHPDHEIQWDVKAYVTGMAESNTITLNYKQVIEEFDVKFSKNNRMITVGPLQSFMKQMIPDGLEVEVLVYKNNVLIEEFSKTSVDGFVKFNIQPNVLKNDSYNMIIKTAGLEKSFKPKTLW